MNKNIKKPSDFTIFLALLIFLFMLFNTMGEW